MKKRGAGWIPDYPDQSDYTLAGADQALSDRVQSKGNLASIEVLTKKLCQALNVLSDQADNLKLDKKELTDLRHDLEKEILDEVTFITVDFHDVFNAGTVDTEVFFIKSYLNIFRFYRENFTTYLSMNPMFTDMKIDVTNATLSQEMLDTSREILLPQLVFAKKYYKEYIAKSDYSIGLDDINCLKSIASLISKDLSQDTLLNYWVEYRENKKSSYEALIKNLMDKINGGGIDLRLTYQIDLTHFAIIIQSLIQKIAQLDQLSSSLVNLNIGELNNLVPTFIGYLKKFKTTVTSLNDELQALETAKANLSNSYSCFDLDEDSQRKIKAILDKITPLNDSLINVRQWPDKIECALNQLNSDVLQNSDNTNITKLISPIADKFKFPENLISGSPIKVFCQKIIQEIYEFNLPQIPPQFFEREEIILETAISIDLINLVAKKLVGEVVYKYFLEGESRRNPVKIPLYSAFQAREVQRIVAPPKAGQQSSASLDWETLYECSKEIHALVKPIVPIVVQMLMPMGQDSNLNDAVDKALGKIKHWGREKLTTEAEPLQEKYRKQLIQEMLEQQSGYLPKDVALVDESKLQEMAESALLQILGDLEKREQSNLYKINSKNVCDNRYSYCLSEDCYLSTLKEANMLKEAALKEANMLKEAALREDNILIEIPIDKDKEDEDKDKEDEGMLLKQKKQPLFHVRSRNEPSEGSKQIQFPVSQKIRDDILKCQNNSISKVIESNNNVNDKRNPEKQLDVYLVLPEFVDLSYWFSPVEDQGNLNSCTAHAGIALIEYSQNKSSGTYIDTSPLFLYKVTRNLMQKEGDSGASMRDTMKAMVAFGVCPEEHWSYDEALFDQEPDAFCYSFAESFKALKYFRLDYGTISKSTLLAQVKVLLTSEIPCAFGFTLYSSVYEDSNFKLGHIPLPTSRDKVVGGHVVVAVGYHDHKVIKNSNGDEFEGALLIRNSWGSKWGQGGYGWMPYEYVTKGLTADWWSLLKAEWLASGSFGAGASAWARSSGGPDGGQPPTL